MSQEIKPLAGNTAADLIVWLQQFPQNTVINVVDVDYCGYETYGFYTEINDTIVELQGEEINLGNR